jgi:hypothetical protein
MAGRQGGRPHKIDWRTEVCKRLETMCVPATARNTGWMPAAYSAETTWQCTKEITVNTAIRYYWAESGGYACATAGYWVRVLSLTLAIKGWSPLPMTICTVCGSPTGCPSISITSLVSRGGALRPGSSVSWANVSSAPSSRMQASGDEQPIQVHELPSISWTAATNGKAQEQQQQCPDV